MTLHAITNNKSHNSCCDQIKLSCFLGSKEKEEFQLESLAMKKPKSNWDDLALSHLFQPRLQLAFQKPSISKSDAASTSALGATETYRKCFQI